LQDNNFRKAKHFYLFIGGERSLNTIAATLPKKETNYLMAQKRSSLNSPKIFTIDFVLIRPHTVLFRS